MVLALWLVTVLTKTGNIELSLPRSGLKLMLGQLFSRLLFHSATFHSPMLPGLARTTRTAFTAYSALRLQASVAMGLLVAVRARGSREDIYNILWAVVFGFATLNILGLASRRLEPTRRGMSFGEMMAVLIVLLSIFLLGWEMLNLFHIFPIKLHH